jgi:hypothetical protein
LKKSNNKIDLLKIIKKENYEIENTNEDIFEPFVMEEYSINLCKTIDISLCDIAFIPYTCIKS